MATTLDASTLSLDDVYRLFRFEQRLGNSISSWLTLEPLSEFEQRELAQIRDTFQNYYAAGKISEGQVKFLLLAPLMRLAGFYQPQIKITLEEGIADISTVDQESIVKGRMDILAVNKTEENLVTTSLWILVIESKNTSVEVLEGLPQLLTYAYKSLETQASVWGLTTNGQRYQFVYLEQGDPPTYQLFPDISLIYPERAVELLQVLKAICQG
ncbi:MAG: restriction endonuclease subunit R [Leptolyngbyaceae cyanobacterium RM2_2_4]|nr:restriction endonuclease subunit R [Leptolyngbyaceae cyanobacterium SM1_4_3]NJN58752.1 restriction endonuclease subunit R [Leptolyngbyaceae cyanobacterium SL_5_9]NJO52392.1 restriction endonuclease subunit R [Leptolyngbyaceae cyanobacterium RM2_2_4]